MKPELLLFIDWNKPDFKWNKPDFKAGGSVVNNTLNFIALKNINFAYSIKHILSFLLITLSNF